MLQMKKLKRERLAQSRRNQSAHPSCGKLNVYRDPSFNELRLFLERASATCTHHQSGSYSAVSGVRAIHQTSS